MFYDDIPIDKQSNDLLKRGTFAERLGKTIINLDAKDGICVGILGSWGSGKTSIINMMRETIERSAQTKPSIVTFSPWNYTTGEQLFRQLFYAIANSLTENNDKDKELYGLSKTIIDYADIASNVPIKLIGSGSKMIKGCLTFINNKSILNGCDLGQQRDKIIKQLENLDHKILVIIDDIDRLSNMEIRLIFQLVASVAKFPNIIYILSFDRKIVSRALSEVQGCDGEGYIEKVVQIPIEIPEIRSDSINDIFLKRLNEMMSEYKLDFDQKYWQQIYFKCVDGNIESIREVNRICNTLSMKCVMLEDNVDFADLISITIIEIKYPDLYYWIKTHKDELVVNTKGLMRNTGKDGNTIAREKNEEIKCLNAEKANKYIEMLDTLFPHWKRGTEYYGYQDNDVLRRQQRIGHPNFFDRYFVFGLDDSEIARDKINSALFDMDEGKLIKFVEDMDKCSRGINLISEVRAALDELDDNRKILLAKVYIRKGALLQESDDNHIFTVYSSKQAEFLVEQLLCSINSPQIVYDFLKEEIINADIDSIQVLSVLINSSELSYGRLSAKGVPRTDQNSFVSENQLQEYEGLYVKQIKKISEISDLFDEVNAYMVLYLFESFDKKGYDEYLQRQLINPLEVLKYVQVYIGKSDGSNGISWKYHGGCENYISIEKIFEALNICVSDGSFQTLSQLQQKKIAAFDLWVNNPPDDVKTRGISDSEAIKKLREYN